ncbi:MAG: hypothetical protein ABIW84_03695 [Ilumatobacteraceae bacterium]
MRSLYEVIADDTTPDFRHGMEVGAAWGRIMLLKAMGYEDFAYECYLDVGVAEIVMRMAEMEGMDVSSVENGTDRMVVRFRLAP